MSTVLVIIVCGRRITTLHHHYRIIEELLCSDPCSIHSIKNDTPPRLDSGYILIDCNSQIIINAQIAFALREFPGYSTMHVL